jgi:TonB family protein
MPDAARVAQAMAVEIPVTVQGSKTADGEGRELFRETTKTILAFDNGAVLKLQSKVLPGQSLFLRNEQSGSEAICKVVEAPAEGQEGYTELEFVAPHPEFWGIYGEKPATPQPHAPPERDSTRQQNATAPDQIRSAVTGQTPATAAPPPTSPNAFARQREEIVPAHEAAPAATGPSPVSAPAEETPLDQLRVPTGEQIDAALQTIKAAFPAPSFDSAGARGQESHEESVNANDARNLTALMALDAKRARRADVQKPIPAQKTDPGTAAQKSPDANSPLGPTPSLQERVTAGVETLTSGKGLILSEVALSVVVLAALGFIWHAVRPLFSSGNQRAAAASMRPSVASSTALPAQAATSIPAGGKVVVPQAASKPAINSALTEPMNSAPKKAGSVENVLRHAISQRSVAETPKSTAVTQNFVDRAEELKTSLANSSAAAAAKIPAKIVWQVQPGFPSWAKELEVDGVVKLDAVIDEDGNVTRTRIISGPRALQHSAQQAVMLWLFEPAQQDGKPVASHMTLTVVFQQ